MTCGRDHRTGIRDQVGTEPSDVAALRSPIPDPRSPIPAVSVVMTVYNRTDFVPDAVRSILNQTLRDLELIVVDDGSDAPTKAMLRELAESDPRMRAIEQDNAGIFVAANAGLRACRAPLVARLDSDDLAEPTRLEIQKAFFDDSANAEVVCCGTFMKLVDAQNRFLHIEVKPTDDQAIQEDLLRGHCAIGHPSSMMRRSALERIGGYDESFTSAGDLEIFLRLGEVGKLANLDAPLTRYRLHAQSVSEEKGLKQRENCRRACELAWARRGETRPFEGADLWRPAGDRDSEHHYALRYGWWAWRAGQFATAAHYGKRALKLKPWDKQAWMLWMKSRGKANQPEPRHAGSGIGDQGTGRQDSPTNPTPANSGPDPRSPIPAPRVSVAMPMRDAAKFVADSVRSVLSQATPACSVQLVIVDDGSTDGSADVVRAVLDEADWPHTHTEILPGPQSGIAAALNAAFARCTGTYLARCDSDDLFPPGRLATHAAFLDSTEGGDFVAVCGGFETIDPKGRLIDVLHKDCRAREFTADLRDGTTPTHFGTFLIRRVLVEQLGGARDYFAGTEDVDLQLRIGTAGRVWFAPATAYSYRLHHQSSTHTQASPTREFLTEQARKFARQRADGLEDDLARGVAEAPPPDDTTAEGGKPMNVKEQIQGMLIGRSWKAVAAGRRGESLRHGWAALKARPAAAAGWTNLLKLLVLPTIRPHDHSPTPARR